MLHFSLFIFHFLIITSQCIFLSKPNRLEENLLGLFSFQTPPLFNYGSLFTLHFSLFKITSQCIFLSKPNRLEENLLGLFSFQTFHFSILPPAFDFNIIGFQPADGINKGAGQPGIGNQWNVKIHGRAPDLVVVV